MVLKRSLFMKGDDKEDDRELDLYINKPSSLLQAFKQTCNMNIRDSHRNETAIHLSLFLSFFLSFFSFLTLETLIQGERTRERQCGVSYPFLSSALPGRLHHTCDYPCHAVLKSRTLQSHIKEDLIALKETTTQVLCPKQLDQRNGLSFNIVKELVWFPPRSRSQRDATSMRFWYWLELGHTQHH